MIRRLIAALALMALAACASVEAKSPAQRIYAAQSDFNAVLAVAVAYESQPRCTATVTKACSDPAIVVVIRKSAVDADTALMAAQNTVRSPFSTGSTVELAITGALNSISALRAILKNHNIGG